MIPGFGGPEIAVLLAKLEVQGRSKLFLQGDVQRQFVKPEMTEVYGMGIAQGPLFSTKVRGVSIYLVDEDIARIMEIPNEGWNHYVKMNGRP